MAHNAQNVAAIQNGPYIVPVTEEMVSTIKTTILNRNFRCNRREACGSGAAAGPAPNSQQPGPASSSGIQMNVIPASAGLAPPSVPPTPRQPAAVFLNDPLARLRPMTSRPRPPVYPRNNDQLRVSNSRASTASNQRTPAVPAAAQPTTERFRSEVRVRSQNQNSSVNVREPVPRVPTNRAQGTTASASSSGVQNVQRSNLRAWSPLASSSESRESTSGIRRAPTARAAVQLTGNQNPTQNAQRSHLAEGRASTSGIKRPASSSRPSVADFQPAAAERPVPAREQRQVLMREERPSASVQLPRKAEASTNRRIFAPAAQNVVQQPPQHAVLARIPQQIGGEYEDEDNAAAVDSQDEESDPNIPGTSARTFRKRAKVDYYGPAMKKNDPRPPIRFSGSEDEVVSSKIIDGNKFTINIVGKVVVDDEDILSEDDTIEEVEKKEKEGRHHEVLYAAILEVPVVSRKAMLAFFKKEIKKLTDLVVIISKIRDFPFANAQLELVWDTTPMSESAKAMRPTRLLHANVLVAKRLLELTCDEWEEQFFTHPDDRQEWLKEIDERCRSIASSSRAPKDCQIERKFIWLVDIVERTKGAGKFDELAAKFPLMKDDAKKLKNDAKELKVAAEELKTLMGSWEQFHKFDKMLKSNSFKTEVVLHDLVEMVRLRYMPRGVMYLKFLLNVAYHFQFSIDSEKWVMLPVKEDRIFEGINFNQLKEPIIRKPLPDIHNT